MEGRDPAAGIDIRPASIDRFALRLQPVGASMSCAAVYERFHADPDLMALAVVVDERPVGLVCRGDFEHRLAHHFGRALYERKPVAVLMDPKPLIVERSLSIEAIQHAIATDRPSALMRGFVITDDGSYLGLGTAAGLLQATLLRTEERNRELERAYAAAAESSRAKSAFLANMSHELRTPLNAIIGFSELIKLTAPGRAPARLIEYAGDIHASGQHLLSLVNDLLDMAKIEAGRFEIEDGVVDLACVVDMVVRMTSPAAALARLALDVRVDRDLPLLRGDERAIRQILLNLVSNAVKFTPADGRVVVFGESRRGAVVFGVADTGVGMSEDEVAIALTPFGQVSGALNRRHQGTGLGLPLARSIAELHGGTLDVASAPGRGTTVTVRLPVALEAAAD
ncbi:MAG: histidine kinase [Alphaproteobacteria bacterium]|nr:histidine kinase [Alphaproteobacteria bacterium]